MQSAALTIGLALGAGMLAQIAAWHLRVPGIVLLLGLGVLLGPEVSGILDPSALGGGMRVLVGFAVAVILFEGGLSLNIGQLRREAKSIRQLVTIGALVTAVGGTLAAKYFLGWGWPPSILFGCLVIVTGPTVVTPLLRRIKVKRRVATTLEAEGVFGDAIGAILAIVALEVIVTPKASVLGGAGAVFATLGTGIAIGIICGLIIASLLKREGLVPEGLATVTTLSLVLASYQISNSLFHESGIAAAIVAGLVVGNTDSSALEELKHFKEQLTVMFIALLFVLLAADVRLENVLGLGWPGLWTVGALMFIVRPINVLVSTMGTEVTNREKLFMSWMAPRGIVAAAVASLFATELAAAGIPGGPELQGLVFLVIAATVLLQGLSGGMLAKALDITQPNAEGYAFLGANALSRTLAKRLVTLGEEVVLIDTNVDSCHATEEAGLRVLYGSGLKESLQLRAELGMRKGAIAMTPSDTANLLFVEAARKRHKVHATWATLHNRARVTPAMLESSGGRLLFGRTGDPDHWITRIERGRATEEAWIVGPDASGLPPYALPMIQVKDSAMEIIDPSTVPAPGATIWLLMPEDARTDAERWLTEHGWTRVVDESE